MATKFPRPGHTRVQVDPRTVLLHQRAYTGRSGGKISGWVHDLPVIVDILIAELESFSKPKKRHHFDRSRRTSELFSGSFRLLPFYSSVSSR